jgi:hypothetical protein
MIRIALPRSGRMRAGDCLQGGMTCCPQPRQRDGAACCQGLYPRVDVRSATGVLPVVEIALRWLRWSSGTRAQRANCAREARELR